MGLLISLWVGCFIVLVARQYWSSVVTVSKKVAEIVFRTDVLLVTPIICVPVLLILGLDTSVLANIGILYLAIMVLSVTFYIIFDDDGEW